ARYELEERDSARARLEEMWGQEDEDLGPEQFAAAPGEPEGELEMPELVAGPREGQREAVQARALLEKAERLLAGVQPEDRAEIEKLMERVRTALTDRQWERVTSASNELADILFYLEDA